MTKRDSVDHLLDWAGPRNEALNKIRTIITDPQWQDDTPAGLREAIEEVFRELD